MSANFRPETLSEIARRFNLAVECRCGHSGVVDGPKLSRYFFVHVWSGQKHLIGDHLRCSRCGARPVNWGPTSSLPTGPEWGPRDERGWQRLVRRMRG